jgi:hypothetical protein
MWLFSAKCFAIKSCVPLCGALSQRHTVTVGVGVDAPQLAFKGVHCTLSESLLHHSVLQVGCVRATQ